MPLAASKVYISGLMQSNTNERSGTGDTDYARKLYQALQSMLAADIDS